MASEIPSGPGVPALDNTFGAGFIGALIAGVLYGITNLQTYFYYVHYPKDGFDLKLLVAFIWVLDTLQFAFVSLTMYHYLVSNYANPVALRDAHWALNISVLMNVIIGVLAQTFFTIRICRREPSKASPVGGRSHSQASSSVQSKISMTDPRAYLSQPTSVRTLDLCLYRPKLILISRFGSSVKVWELHRSETVVFLFIKKEFSRIPEITLVAATPFAIFAVLSDVAIAAALCILLHGSRTGFRKTNTIVTQLIVYAINRCILTSVVAIIEVIVFALMPESLWFVAIDFVIGKLYANSLLATLNSRNAIRERGGSQANSVGLSNLGFSSGSSGRDDHVLSISVGGSSTDRTESSVSYNGPRHPDIKKDTVKILETPI
ncbi:hypothetical protein ONZ45_g10195 [Pleurotus djamor]|nr:hypothetical protein ONZ45_g10195 [Pleurotus djamor]